MCIPAGSNEDTPAPIGTDSSVEFVAQVVNNGAAASSAALVISLPATLRLESDEDDPVVRYEDWWSDNSTDDGTPLDCTVDDSGSVVTCATGSVPAGANFLVAIDLTAQDGAVTGTSGTFMVALESTPTPGTFPTTSVHAAVDFVGTAHLQVHLSPTTATVVVGQSLTLDATVHNVGPNTAVEAGAVGFVFADSLDQQPFLITNSAPLPGSGSASGSDSGAAFALRALPARFASARPAGAGSLASRPSASRFSVVRPTGSQISAPPTAIGFWPIGTIAPGGTASIQVVVKAESAGQAELDFDASSADESCDGDNIPGCENTATAELTAVAAATTTATTATATTSAQSASATSATGNSPTSAAALPNTGFRPTPWLNSAGAVILLGMALMMIGAPRRRVCGRHR